MRLEDDLSYPGHPFSLGIIIQEVKAFTMNNEWEPEFISNQEITNK